MNFNEEALKLHAENHGKLVVDFNCTIEDADDLSVAYTPGVAAPCREIHAHPEDAYTYTIKSHTIAVVSNGTAVLGLGDIGPEAAMPVMEGKSALFKRFGGVDAFPICIDAKTPEEVIAAVKAIAPTFGGINLEDIKSPDCFTIEAELERDLDIPVFHDDQHSTAIVVTAALINALKVVGKNIADVKVVLNGAGAAGTAILKMLLAAGAKNVIGVDSKGALYRGREGMNPFKAELAELTNPENESGTLADVIAGADAFIGTSVAGALTADMVRSMTDAPIVFAMANPVPEIMYDEAIEAGAAVMATGRSDMPNQVNNLLAFPGIFAGALDVQARDINTEMKLAAARAIAGLVTDEERSAEYIIPSALESRVVTAVRHAVAQAAIDTNVAHKPEGIVTD